jgi:hypothetical protein
MSATELRAGVSLIRSTRNDVYRPARTATVRGGGALGELPGQVEKRLLEVVVGLGRDLVVLDVLLPVEVDLLGLHLALLDLHLVAAEHLRQKY